MKRSLSLFVLILICCLSFSAQWSIEDFNVKVNGLDDKVTQRFKNKGIEHLVRQFNYYQIPKILAPVDIIVECEKSQGFIALICNYDEKTVFSKYSMYTRLDDQCLGFNDEKFGMHLQDQLFLALYGFKQCGALDGWIVDNRIMKFKKWVKLKKKNNDFIAIEASDYELSNGMIENVFANYLIVCKDGKRKQIECNNMQALQKMKCFGINLRELDGSSTGIEIVKEFYNIDGRK